MDSQLLTRKPLNQKQLAILDQLYRYRFATTQLLTQSLGSQNKGKMNGRLKVLLEQDYVGRNYDASYRLRNQHATYFLEARGIKTLRGLPGATYSPAVLSNMYKDKTASNRFITHSLAVYQTRNTLADSFGKRLKFITKTKLSGYDYFPNHLPDAYIRLSTGETERQFFIDILDASQPFVAQLGKIKNFVSYFEEEEWEERTGTALPVALLVCHTVLQAERLRKYADRELYGFDADDEQFVITSLDKLTNILDT